MGIIGREYIIRDTSYSFCLSDTKRKRAILIRGKIVTVTSEAYTVDAGGNTHPHRIPRMKRCIQVIHEGETYRVFFIPENLIH